MTGSIGKIRHTVYHPCYPVPSILVKQNPHFQVPCRSLSCRSQQNIININERPVKTSQVLQMDVHLSLDVRHGVDVSHSSDMKYPALER